MCLFWGCATLPSSQQASVRNPGRWRYGEPVPIGCFADKLAPYAALAANVYNSAYKERTRAHSVHPSQEEKFEDAASSPATAECLRQSASVLRSAIPLWRRWEHFPSPYLRCRNEIVGLYVEVWERATPDREIAIVFKGTENDTLAVAFPDWFSNFRWLGVLLPDWLKTDQYTQTAGELADEFRYRLEHEGWPNRTGDEALKIVTVGHSLGGGLAQYFAYSFSNTSPRGLIVPSISRVYAFNSSPVTGWTDVPCKVRCRNASSLQIFRAFEFGEILAYPRFVAESLSPRRSCCPVIHTIRFNMVKSVNPTDSHSMLRLACGLLESSSTTLSITDDVDQTYVTPTCPANIGSLRKRARRCASLDRSPWRDEDSRAPICPSTNVHDRSSLDSRDRRPPIPGIKRMADAPAYAQSVGRRAWPGGNK